MVKKSMKSSHLILLYTRSLQCPSQEMAAHEARQIKWRLARELSLQRKALIAHGQVCLDICLDICLDLFIAHGFPDRKTKT